MLTDQVQGIITHLISNFIDSSSQFNLSLTGVLKQLNGDLRALILVSSTRSQLLNQKLLQALKTLKSRVELVLSSVEPPTAPTTATVKDEQKSEDSGASKTEENVAKIGESPSKVNPEAPNKKRRLSEEPSTSNTTAKSVNKPKDEKTRWKDSLVMFMNTLNLLIGMSENALAANVATSSANEATIEEAPETKPEPKNDEETKTAPVESKPDEK